MSLKKNWTVSKWSLFWVNDVFTCLAGLDPYDVFTCMMFFTCFTGLNPYDVFTCLAGVNPSVSEHFAAQSSNQVSQYWSLIFEPHVHLFLGYETFSLILVHIIDEENELVWKCHCYNRCRGTLVTRSWVSSWNKVFYVLLGCDVTLVVCLLLPNAKCHSYCFVGFNDSVSNTVRTHANHQW